MSTNTKVEWTNPHVHFYVDVKNNKGQVVNWNIELGPPLILRHLGWPENSLKSGDQVTVEGRQTEIPRETPASAAPDSRL